MPTFAYLSLRNGWEFIIWLYYFNAVINYFNVLLYVCLCVCEWVSVLKLFHQLRIHFKSHMYARPHSHIVHTSTSSDFKSSKQVCIGFTILFHCSLKSDWFWFDRWFYCQDTFIHIRRFVIVGGKLLLIFHYLFWVESAFAIERQTDLIQTNKQTETNWNKKEEEEEEVKTTIQNWFWFDFIQP